MLLGGEVSESLFSGLALLVDTLLQGVHPLVHGGEVPTELLLDSAENGRGNVLERVGARWPESLFHRHPGDCPVSGCFCHASRSAVIGSGLILDVEQTFAEVAGDACVVLPGRP
jgi:hypothetical protein